MFIKRHLLPELIDPDDPVLSLPANLLSFRGHAPSTVAVPLGTMMSLNTTDKHSSPVFSFTPCSNPERYWAQIWSRAQDSN